MEVETSVVGVEENLVGECRILLQNITLQVEHEDQRLWKLVVTQLVVCILVSY